LAGAFPSPPESSLGFVEAVGNPTVWAMGRRAFADLGPLPCFSGGAVHASRRLGATIAQIQQSGVTSFRSIAAALNDQSIRTARGWLAVQAQRVMER